MGTQTALEAVANRKTSFNFFRLIAGFPGSFCFIQDVKAQPKPVFVSGIEIEVGSAVPW